MDKEEGALLQQPPILAEVAAHPATGNLMIVLNEEIPEHQQVDFCLACTHAFIGYAQNVLHKPKSNIVVPKVVVP